MVIVWPGPVNIQDPSHIPESGIAGAGKGNHLQEGMSTDEETSDLVTR